MAKTGPKQKPRHERFYERVDKSDDCWIWTGVINHKRGGYGHFYDDDTRLRRAHRVAWEMEHGLITEADVVMHTCDTPACVRLDHLRLGTQVENLTDMRWKGRGAVPLPEHGADRYNAKLDEEKVRGLRRAKAEGRSIADLARQMGVSATCAKMAANGKSWRHVS